MALWGSIDQANNSPKFGAMLLQVGAGNAAQASNTTALYENTTPSAFKSQQADGVFGVDKAMIANTAGEGARLNHTGWNLRRGGTGPIKIVVPNAAGSGYSNTDVGTISSSVAGAVNATFSLVTNATGAIISTPITSPGSGFPNVSSLSVAVANSTGGSSGGSAGTFTVTLGGRAGRVSYECLVAQGITSTTNTAQLPE